MILYNFSLAKSYGNNSAKKIVEIVDYITYRPLTRKYNKYSIIDWSGYSFLLHPKKLFRANYKKNFGYREMAEYIWLSSIRNYSEYVITGMLSLDLLACTGKEDIINNNSLLQIVENKVYFKFEEAHRGDLKWR